MNLENIKIFKYKLIKSGNHQCTLLSAKEMNYVFDVGDLSM